MFIWKKRKVTENITKCSSFKFIRKYVNLKNNFQNILVLKMKIVVNL